MTPQAAAQLRQPALQPQPSRPARTIETETGATANLVVNDDQQRLEIRDE